MKSQALKNIKESLIELVENVTNEADLLGEIKAIKSTIDKLEKQVKNDVIKEQVKALNGDYYRLTVSDVDAIEKDAINWQAIAEHFKPSRQLITAYTTKNVITRQGYKRFNIKSL